MKTNFISLYKLHFKVASKSIDPKFILGFLSGPTMPNSVSDYCSNDYGTLTWAIEKCDKDPNCEFCMHCKTNRARIGRTDLDTLTSIPPAKHWLDQIIADHKILNDDDN